MPQHIRTSVATARVCPPRATASSTGSCGGARRRAAADAVSPQAAEATEARPELTLYANMTRRQLLRARWVRNGDSPFRPLPHPPSPPSPPPPPPAHLPGVASRPLRALACALALGTGRSALPPYASITAPPFYCRRTLRGVEDRVLRVQHVGLLATALADDLDQRARKQLRELTGNAWCTGCPITRKGAVVNDLNRSAAHDVEHFCRAEARGLLGLRPTMTCCGRVEGCHNCHPGERKTKDNATLSWSVRRWLPVWAGLSYPPEYPPPERPWKCRHPLCTGEDRARFP